jgi:hypothetical protein
VSSKPGIGYLSALPRSAGPILRRSQEKHHGACTTGLNGMHMCCKVAGTMRNVSWAPIRDFGESTVLHCKRSGRYAQHQEPSNSFL